MTLLLTYISLNSIRICCSEVKTLLNSVQCNLLETFSVAYQCFNGVILIMPHIVQLIG